MPIIKVESINVDRIFGEAFTTLTRKLSSVELESKEEGEFVQKPHLFIVKTKGAFQGYISAEIENGLLEEIVTRINKGRKLQSGEKILFAMEYLNIVCGRALSEINNQTGTSSRLTVPQYVTGKTPEEPAFGERETLFYQSTYGGLKLKLIYKFERKG